MFGDIEEEETYKCYDQRKKLTKTMMLLAKQELISKETFLHEPHNPREGVARKWTQHSKQGARI